MHGPRVELGASGVETPAINIDMDVSAIDFTVNETPRPVPWTSYKTIVKEDVVSLMVDYDKQSTTTQKALLQKVPHCFFLLLLATCCRHRCHLR